VAAATITVKFCKLYEEYRARLLPVVDKHLVLAGAPNSIEIESTLAEVYNFLDEARSASWRNHWDSAWEEGIAGYPVAIDKLESLHNKMMGKWYIFEQIERDSVRDLDLARQNKKQTRLTIWSIAATILVGVLTVVVSYLLITR
jgi:hypothetical protein